MLITSKAKKQAIVRFATIPTDSTAANTYSASILKRSARPQVLTDSGFSSPKSHLTSPFGSGVNEGVSLLEDIGRLKKLRSKTMHQLDSPVGVPALHLSPNSASSQSNRLRMRLILRTADNLIHNCKKRIQPKKGSIGQLVNAENGIKRSVRDIMSVGTIKVKQGFNISRKKFLEDDHLLTRVQIKRMIEDVRLKIKRVRNQI